jgi:hypothetical protein
MKIWNVSKIHNRALISQAKFSEKITIRTTQKKMELVKIYEYNSAEVAYR